MAKRRGPSLETAQRLLKLAAQLLSLYELIRKAF
jgi:hypothetical protein